MRKVNGQANIQFIIVGLVIVSIIISGVSLAMISGVRSAPKNTATKNDLDDLNNSLGNRIGSLEERISAMEEEIGAKKARIVVTNISVPETVKAGETTTVTALVANTGEKEGTQSIDLVVDGETVDTNSVTLAPEQTESVKFEFTKNEPGDYEINIRGAKATLSVSAAGPKLEKVNIGVIEPLSGYHAPFGTEARDGYELAAKQINEGGGIKSLGGAKINLMIQGDEDTSEGARMAAEKLAPKCPIICGAYVSRHTLTIAETVEGKSIHVLDALSDYITRGEFDHVFRPPASAAQEGKAAVRAVLDINEKYGEEPIETAALLNEDSVFGKYVAMGMKEELLAAGINIVYREEYSWDISDVNPLLTKIHANNPDVVFICPYFQDSILWAKAVQKRGPGAKFWAGAGECGFADASSIEEGGEAVEYFTNSYNFNPVSAKDFLEAFKSEYGYKPAGPGAEGYYGLWTVKEVLEEAGKRYPENPLSYDHLKTVFSEIEITSGPAVEAYPGSKISFDADGNAEHIRPAVWQVIDGESHVIWPFDTAERDPVYPRPDWKGE